MTVAAGPLSECLTNKYSRYAKAQETWQRNVTELIVELVPRYEEAAQMYLTDQLRAIEQAKLAVEFLARQEPDKLRTQMSLNNWLSLEGTDRRRIAASDERYAELLELHTAARKRPPHPDGDALREVIRSEVMTSGQYKELLEAYSRSVQAAEDIQCQ
jgi:hypothetical protein